MHASHAKLISFVIDRAEAEPVRVRIELYRALADFCGDQALCQNLLLQSNLLEQADALNREFDLNLKHQVRASTQGHDGEDVNGYPIP